jgi:NTP pyrophosphatase (non-canonical NTP hydrolase)
MANVAKKLRRHEVMVEESETWWYERHEKKKTKLRQHLADEVADTIIYLDLLCASQGIDLEEAIKKKFNETSAKIGYKRKFR